MRARLRFSRRSMMLLSHEELSSATNDFDGTGLEPTSLEQSTALPHRFSPWVEILDKNSRVYLFPPTIKQIVLLL